MKRIQLLFSLAALAAVLPMSRAGDVSGTVTLKGTPPPEKDIAPLKNDVNCGKFHPEMPKTRFYAVSANGGLADVVVVIKGVPNAKSTGPAAPPVVLDQKGCEYTPYVFAVQTDQKITAKNSDPVMHNVHAVPAIAGNTEKNQAQAPGGPDLTFTFPKPETFLKFECNVHPWMFSYACVIDHPYFAVTDKDGKFTIKNVPDGKYTIQALHRKAAPASSPASKDIEVKGATTADFTLEVK
jgi:plastocyanin